MSAPASCFESRWRKVSSPEKRSNGTCSKCVNDSLPIRSSKTSPTRLTSSLTLLGLLTFSAASLHAAKLTPVATNDPQIVHRWELAGEPRGVAVGPDGIIYAGLAKDQAIVAIDPK